MGNLKCAYAVRECYVTPYEDTISYEGSIIGNFNTEEEAIAVAKKYAFLLSDHALYSVERYILWNDGTIDFDKRICLINNKDGEGE